MPRTPRLSHRRLQLLQLLVVSALSQTGRVGGLQGHAQRAGEPVPLALEVCTGPALMGIPRLGGGGQWLRSSEKTRRRLGQYGTLPGTRTCPDQLLVA